MDNSLVLACLPTRSQRLVAIVSAGLLVIIGLAAVPYSQVALRPRPGFMPVFGALTVLTDALTAGLLLTQAYVAGDRSKLRLGAAYAFSSLIILPHLAAFPAVGASPLIGSSVSAVWLWCAWHGGFAFCVIRFIVARSGDLRPGHLRQTLACTIGAVVLLTALATVGLPLLPSLLQSGTSYGALTSTGIGPVILGVTVFATFLVLTRLRFRTVLGMWLAVGMLAATLDVLLTLIAGSRFSVGWYAGRLLSLVTGVTILFALLSELMREAGRVAEVNSHLQHLLQEDVLTGMANRRAFQTALDAEWRRASREQTVLSLLMIDIDSFKGFNDRYGHPAGDTCLRQVAQAMATHVHRPADLPARIGGEEFAILLPNTEEGGALRVAERVRASVENLFLPHESSVTGHVTVSIGVATAFPHGPTSDPDDLVAAADRALYDAKAAGRNTVRGTDQPSVALVRL